jgi:hypothetical protein
MADEAVASALAAVRQELLPRRLNFVPARFEYRLDIAETLVFDKATEDYSVCYGAVKRGAAVTRPSIYDPRRLAQIKSWAQRYRVGAGLSDAANRGFAISVLYALRACPCFRQFAGFHQEFCTRVGCTLCKLYRFFGDTQGATPHFPLDLIVFDRSYRPGATGDSAEFFVNLMGVLQNEELGTHRSFGSISEYTSAIGQMFHMESVTKFACEKCHRVRAAKSSYWTLTSVDSLNPENRSAIEEAACDACGHSPLYVSETLSELPLIVTIQVRHWSASRAFHQKKFDFERFLRLNINGRDYRLCGFTEYRGSSSEGGEFGCVFLSSSGTWNVVRDSKIESIPVSALSEFHPQLLFLTVNEANAAVERSSLVRVREDAAAASDSGDAEADRTATAPTADAFAQAIADRLRRRERGEPQEAAVVEAGGPRRARAEKPRAGVGAENPLGRLLQSRRVHEVARWDGVQVAADRQEVVQPWREAGFDAWDRKLDQGHVRKVKKKRPAPIENPFDHVPIKRTTESFRKPR